MNQQAILDAIAQLGTDVNTGFDVLKTDVEALKAAGAPDLTPIHDALAAFGADTIAKLQALDAEVKA